MPLKNKMLTLSALAAFVLLGVAAVNHPSQKERNLKVLPKDISDEKLDSIMHTYNIALGVKCNFCHVQLKDFADSLDFASDKEPMKENARDMMRMVIDINSKYFSYDSGKPAEYLNAITCKTCHRGEPFPPE
jgi:hypothetical protein